MEGYGPETYGERIAEVYDELFHPPTRPEDTVEFLAGLAGGGSVLELAYRKRADRAPLVARGIEVHGIDASEAMVAKLRAKPGGGDIPVMIGDFADAVGGVTLPTDRHRLQHAVGAAHAGGSGAMRAQRCGPRDRGRHVRNRDVRPGPGPVRSRSADPRADHRVPSCPAGRLPARS
jgi:hypothetical protein